MSEKINIINLNKTFNNKEPLQVLKDINIKVYTNEFVSIIGPSGCGKSTIFNIATKLDKDYTGDVYIDDKNLKDTDKIFAYMPQKDLLFPWLKLKDNLYLPLKLAGYKKEEGYKKINEYVKTFGLAEFLNSYPHELSGGMKQRAALFRTFLVESDLMLLDEPFGALDAITRDKMQNFILSIWRQLQRSVLFITHSIDEAIYLSDRVYVLSDRPAKVKLELEIKIKRPRDKSIITTVEFNNYKKKLLEALM